MIYIKRRSVLIIGVLLITALTFIMCFSALSKSPAGEATASKIKVVLDAGHGGIDGGVIGVNSGIKESDLNLIITKKVEKYLSDSGISVVLTRSTEAGLYGVATKNFKKLDMEKRKEIILKAQPNLVVSIHMNKYSLSTRRGAQVFYKAGDENGKLLAQSLQSVFNAMPEATRECSILSGDYYILKCNKFPSVIAECGFLSSPEDEALLITEEYQDKIANSIYKGIIGYLAQQSSSEKVK